MTNSIFQEPWWLEAVAPGQWGEVVIKEDGAIIGRLPYITKKRYGFTLLTMPKLTPMLGPWLESSDGKYVTQISRSRSLMNQLIEGLPEFDFFVQSFHYSIKDWLPFYWQGFHQTTQYSYIIDETELDKVWQNIHKNTRLSIRKAEKKGIKVIESEDLDTLWRINAMSFARQGLKVPYSFDLLQRIDAACKPRQARKIYIALDENSRVHSVKYFIYDRLKVYTLIAGDDPALRQSGAHSLCQWEAIKFAVSTSRTFDSSGSMMPNIEPFMRRFGGIQTPYFKITKINSVVAQIAYDLMGWGQRLKNSIRNKNNRS